MPEATARYCGEVPLLRLTTPEPELHIVYEYLAHQRGGHSLVQAHGPLRFATGSHTDLSLNFWNEGMKPSKYPFFAYSMIEERFPIAQLGAVGPGDVSAHLGWSVDLRLELDQRSAI